MRTLLGRTNEVSRYSFMKPLNLILLSISLLAVGCSDEKDDPEPSPPVPPTHGAVAIACEWDACQEAADELPSQYIIGIGANCRSLEREATFYPDSLPAGTYPVLAYNEPAHFQIENKIASVLRTDSGTLCPDPGFLFSTETEVTVRAGETAELGLRMRQHVRSLSLGIRAKDEAALSAVRGLSAELSGVVSAVRLGSGAPEGESARLVFPLEVAKTRELGWLGEARSLGFVPGERVRLTLRIVFADGSEEERSYDVTAELEDFGEGIEPFRLEADLSVEERPEGGFTASIAGWKVNDERVEIEYE